MLEDLELNLEDDSSFYEMYLADIETNEPVTEEDLRLAELESLIFSTTI